jgi:hypothetical protein
MFIPTSAREFPSLCKVRDIRMQTWESESVVVRRPLYLTHLLDLKFDFSFLLYLLQDGAMSAVAVVHCSSSLLVEFLNENSQFCERYVGESTRL